jgi:RNA polymerase sigma-70 factor (ECF subfamily)
MTAVATRSVRLAEDHELGPPEDPIEKLYRLHAQPLLRFLLGLTRGDRRAAEDLVQETFLRAWRFLNDHEADAEKLWPWLYTVARRAAIDTARARQARPIEVIVTDQGLLASAHDDIERLLVALTIRRALMSLSPAHRQVLIEIYYHGRSAREAAEALGIPEGTVKSRGFHALRALGAIAAKAEPER